MKIIGYEAICNLGNNLDDIYQNAIIANNSCFESLEGYLPQKLMRAGVIKTDLETVENENFNLRCNRLLQKNVKLLQKNIDSLFEKYQRDRVAVVAATTNSGVEEFEKSDNQRHSELGNPALFLMRLLNLTGFYTTVSTACSSGIKAFSTARDLLRNNICDAVIVACVDTLAKVPIFGFESLEVLSANPSSPFGKDREGMNMGEASAVFIVEKDGIGIDVMGIGESSDIYHSTTPDPEAEAAIKAINEALQEANLNPCDIDYINAHGTGTVANDIMEAKAIFQIFKNTVPVSSTKSLTGHCLGAAAGIETALCCKLLDNFDGRLYPHIFNGVYDETLFPIRLVQKDEKYDKCKICMCNSFGFGGTNAIMILGKNDE
ncbi:MAG: hypothetical protein K6C94_09095 [Candidatus Gastranaerophilales bacterium]|nr:hypothetical protein [Candidatus Gastranaerophilales bacterium]